MKKVKFAKIFKIFRLNKSLTQFEVARMFKTSQARVSKIEKGILNPNANEILYLLSLLGKDSYNVLAELREIGVIPLIKVEQ